MVWKTREREKEVLTRERKCLRHETGEEDREVSKRDRKVFREGLREKGKWGRKLPYGRNCKTEKKTCV